MSDQLLERFFQGGCTEEEKRQVMEFFRRNPEKMAPYITEENWEEFDADQDLAAPVPTGRIRRAIESRVGKMEATVANRSLNGTPVDSMPSYNTPVNSTPVRRIGYGWVAAASVVLLGGLFYLLQGKTGHQGQNETRPTPETARIETKPEEKAMALKELSNGSSKTKICYLPDGSKVELSGHSEVSFNDPATNGRRDILLKGEAIFSVKKDRVRPFTVHSGGIATTALGTIFSVSDRRGAFTTVHLYSGRVVVKKEAADNAGHESGGKTFKDIYLSPGQQLVLNQKDFSVQIRNMLPPAATVKTEPAGSPSTGMLTFANQPLEEIFSLLQKEYKVSLSFDPAALRNMSFTGKLNRDKESLESFLNTLCDLNELSLKKTSDTHFVIQAK